MDTLAEVYFKKGEKDKAVELLKKAIEIDPTMEQLKTHLKQIEGAP
jgi:Tfp pilus assembly protein PilF